MQDIATSKINLLTATIQELQEYLTSGTLTSVRLTEAYLKRIENNNLSGLKLRAVIDVAPRESVMKIAQRYDDLRARGEILGELHGIPLLVKDNIATDPALGMRTTAGSFALVNSIPHRDATLVHNLRAQGAIILGKANLTEFANFKGKIPWGWSAVGGQTRSAYTATGNPDGSSSGSAVGVAVGFAAGAIGTETEGSIINPSGRAAAYALKASVGLISCSGIVPYASTADSVGPIARSAYDVAVILGAMVGGPDGDAAKHDHMHANYTQFTRGPYASFRGKRLGVPRDMVSHPDFWDHPDDAIKAEKAMNEAISKMKRLGAIVQDPADIPSMEQWITCGMASQRVVFQTEFKEGIHKYLSEMKSTDVHTLEDIINFNNNHADIAFGPEGPEMGQAKLMRAQQSAGTGSQDYMEALAIIKEVGGTAGIDKVMDNFNLDALVVPTSCRIAPCFASLAGYPVCTVPLGLRDDGEPFGLSFVGRKWSEPTLIGLMAAFEANFPPRAVPTAPELAENAMLDVVAKAA